MTEDKRLIKSYVWHGDKCFFVSTIDRDSSAMLGPRRYAETIVWDYDYATNERGAMISEHGGSENTIWTHMQVCQLLHETGKSETDEDDDADTD